MPNTSVRRLVRTGLAALLALLTIRPTEVAHATEAAHATEVAHATEAACATEAVATENRLSARAHLLVKLRPQAWLEPSRALSPYAFERWTTTLVPGWIRGTLPQVQLARSLAEMAHDPNVIAAEEDHRVQATLVPNDSHWDRQWGPVKVKAPTAWDVTTGDPGVIVAVLDTGADVDHSDLAGQLWVNPGEVPGNGLDDDGNGYADDINGWRFGHDANGNPYGSNVVDDDHGHGTHVTGIIVARGNNGQGTAGMAWGCRAMVVKVLDHEGDGYYSEVANGLVYATDNGARIANLSLGGPEQSQIMEDAIDYANAHDTLVIAAAGNAGSAVLYPAAYAGAVAVAATDRDDQRLSFSCHGPEVDLAAPGSVIYSTCLGNTYCYMSGTSMATPHVAGLAALLCSQRPDYTGAQVTQQLESSAQDIGSPGWDEYTGWGRIDASRALSVTHDSHTIYLPIGTIGQDESWPWPID
jgi:subtilisin family serine protease